MWQSLNIDDNKDTLTITNEKILRVNKSTNLTDGFVSYNYSFSPVGSLAIKYSGNVYIDVIEKNFEFSLKKAKNKKVILEIKKFSDYFPSYAGEKFIFLGKLE